MSKMPSRTRKFASVVLGALVAICATPILPNAYAADGPERISGTERDAIVVDPADAVEVEDAVFYPTGAIDDDTIVVVPEPDGSLPGGLTKSPLRTMLDSSRTGIGGEPDPVVGAYGLHSYVATSSWSDPYIGGTVWGFDETAKIHYSFKVTPDTNQYAVAQGRGFYRGYNGSEFGVWEKWYSLGTANSTSTGGASVPLGEVVANAKFKARSLNVHLAIGSFSP